MKGDGKLTGGCLCDAVRYEITGPFRQVLVCHCGQCRKTHGDRASYTNVKKTDLVMTEERGLKWFRSSQGARRGFCSECGGSIFFEDLTIDSIAVSAGTIDGETGLETVGHIYVVDKGDYYNLPDDGLPRFEGSSVR